MGHSHDRHDLFEAISIEHRALNSLVAQIRAALADLSTSDATIVGLFADLRERVESHFAQEERGGYLVDVVERAPRLSERIERLRAEHSVLDYAVCDLAELANRTVQGPDRNRLGEQFEEFAHKLFAHESAEDTVVQQAFTEDIGTKD